MYIIPMYLSIDILLNRIVEFCEVSANIVLMGMRINIVSNRDKPSDLHPYRCVCELAYLHLRVTTNN